MHGVLKDNCKFNLKPKSVYFWGSKPLGLKCLSYLVQHSKEMKIRLGGFSFYIANETSHASDWAKINNYFKKHRRYSRNKNYDLGFCVGYPKKITAERIRKFKYGIINLHFGPLPYCRGSSILNHLIANKENKFGLTLHYIDESLDTGPIIKIHWYSIPQDKLLIEILLELEEIGFNLFKEYLSKSLTFGKLKSIPQDYYIKKYKIKPKFYTRSSLTRLYRIPSKDRTFDEIYARIRALPLNNGKLPYIEKEGVKIYLSIA